MDATLHLPIARSPLFDHLHVWIWRRGDRSSTVDGKAILEEEAFARNERVILMLSKRNSKGFPTKGLTLSFTSLPGLEQGAPLLPAQWDPGSDLDGLLVGHLPTPLYDSHPSNCYLSSSPSSPVLVFSFHVGGSLTTSPTGSRPAYTAYGLSRSVRGRLSSGEEYKGCVVINGDITNAFCRADDHKSLCGLP